VNKFNFLRWAQSFVEEVKDLTSGGSKVLMVYDGYRSHMGLRVVKTLEAGNVIAYALPSHIRDDAAFGCQCFWSIQNALVRIH